MEKKIWYGFSEKNRQTHFFNADPGKETAQTGALSGIGSFALTGEAKGLNIENVQNVGQRENVG